MPVALLDASVLYPSLIRNLLMPLGTRGLIAARWGDAIHDEWMRNLLADRPDLSAARLARILDLMREALPDVTVVADDHVVQALTLPDPGDRHVLGVAIAGGAEVLVTWNLKDFPVSALAPHGVDPLTPDELLCRLLLDSPTATRLAVEALRQSLRRPPST